MININVSIYLDTRRALKSMQYPVKLQINYLREQKYYSTGIKLFEEDYEKAMAQNPKGVHKDNYLKIIAIQVKAQRIIEKMNYFSFDEFERKMFAKTTIDEMDVYHGFEKYIDNLKRENRFSTASSYNCALKSFMEFKEKLRYMEITPQFLRDYERYMIQQDKSISTVGIYTRNLRTIVNKAISDGIITNDRYPFGRYKYQTPTSLNIKKALPLEDIKKIFDYTAPPGSMKEQARDMWLFSYMANGINPKDIAFLKYSNIKDDKIVLDRQKTIRTERTRQPIVIYITDDINCIIEKWGNKPQDPDSFIFPIITEEMDGEKREKVVQQFVKRINKNMDKIAKSLEIKKKVRCSTARHSCATILKRSGASNKIIGEKLGQQSETTTERYLDSFEDDIKRHWAEALTNFDSIKSSNNSS